MISFAEAKSIVSKHLFLLPSEKIKLENSAQRILAQDIIAPFDFPMFDNSAMDGFAVRAMDTQNASKENPISLKLAGMSTAGSPSTGTLNRGECIQCMTGAKIPEGADAIVMVEDTSGFGSAEFVQIMKETTPGKHIRIKGEEITHGEILVKKGTRITPNEIGSCASFGYAHLLVSKKPRITVLATGDELVKPGKKLKEGQIYNSNLHILSDIAERAGGQVMMREILKDNPNDLEHFLALPLDSNDVIISSGGVSMGKHDYLREVFKHLGIEEHFWQVAQKPGQPLFFGTRNSTLIFGLPGNPVSSFIGFMVWVWPVLQSMMGGEEPEHFKGILKAPFAREQSKTRFLFGEAWLEDGKVFCVPTTKIGSNMLTSALNANCILSAEPGDGILNVGERIDVNILPWKTIS